MSGSDLVRASSDFDGWDPSSIFSSCNTAVYEYNSSISATKDTRAANLSGNHEIDCDHTNVFAARRSYDKTIDSGINNINTVNDDRHNRSNDMSKIRSRGIADTFPETALTTDSSGIFKKIIGLNVTNCDRNEKQLSEETKCQSDLSYHNEQRGQIAESNLIPDKREKLRSAEVPEEQGFETMIKGKRESEAKLRVPPVAEDKSMQMNGEINVFNIREVEIGVSKQNSEENDRLKVMDRDRLLPEYCKSSSRDEKDLLGHETEHCVRNEKERQRQDDVKIERFRSIRNSAEDVMEDSMDYKRNKNIEEDLRMKEEESQLLQYETGQQEKLDGRRKEKETLRRNQNIGIEEENERIAFLEAEEEARRSSSSKGGDSEEDGDEVEDVGDDDSLIGNTECSSRNTDRNIPKNVLTSVLHSPRKASFDYGESVDLDDSLDARGPLSAGNSSRITADSGDHATAHVSHGKNGDFDRSVRNSSDPPVSSSMSANIWERGSAARTLQRLYRGVLGR